MFMNSRILFIYISPNSEMKLPHLTIVVKLAICLAGFPYRQLSGFGANADGAMNGR